MSHTETLAKIRLGPMLLLQGLHTRRMTPEPGLMASNGPTMPPG
ncbi:MULTISPECIES: hypothetical protein [unclassified Pseudomonas]|jgi:hypothetical protein|nr:hypothetical protein [Pseudomonas sp. A-R-26]